MARVWHSEAGAFSGRRPARAAPRRRRWSLALQGGGALGAFTWGVLDRLLEEDEIEFDAISGASAGAVNAVVLAAGLAEGGRAEARSRLERLWRRISVAASLTPFGAGSPLFTGHATFAATAADLSSRIFSPYQLNPLALNPLRGILAAEVDFPRLRSASPVRLLVATTAVRDGRLRIFSEHDLTLEAVLASAALPLVHHAIAIEGEWYWDGGLTANPPLLPLAHVSAAGDILLVQLTPSQYAGNPTFSPQIIRRVQEIAFNMPLVKEVEALSALRALSWSRSGLVSGRLRRKLRRLRLWRIAAEDTMALPGEASAANLDWRFLQKLRDGGRAAADKFLSERDNASLAQLPI